MRLIHLPLGLAQEEYSREYPPMSREPVVRTYGPLLPFSVRGQRQDSPINQFSSITELTSNHAGPNTSFNLITRSAMVSSKTPIPAIFHLGDSLSTARIRFIQLEKMRLYSRFTTGFRYRIPVTAMSFPS